MSIGSGAGTASSAMNDGTELAAVHRSKGARSHQKSSGLHRPPRGNSPIGVLTSS